MCERLSNVWSHLVILTRAKIRAPCQIYVSYCSAHPQPLTPPTTTPHHKHLKHLSFHELSLVVVLLTSSQLTGDESGGADVALNQ